MNNKSNISFPEMKYPYVFMESHKKQPEVIYFDIYSEHGVSICVPIVGEREKIRKVLNPHYTKKVILHQKYLYLKEGNVEMETLTYFKNKLYYRNQSLRIVAPFTEDNMKTLMDYDYLLENHLRKKKENCCILF